MTKHIVAAIILTLITAVAAPSRGADEPAKPAADAAQKPAAPGDSGDAQEAAARDASPAAAVIDKAAAALGGKDKLAAMKGATWSSKGTLTLNGADNPFTLKIVFQGPDRRRVDFDGDFGGTPIKIVAVVNADKGWRRFGDSTEELAADQLDTERRNGYREWAAVNVLALKSAPFKTEAAGESAVDGKPATGVKVTTPAGAPFTIYFDKESGLPVKQVATARTFDGGEATEETTYSNYKDFGGVKKATKIEVKHDGQKLVEAEVTEFKVTDGAEAGAFDKPE